MILIMGPAGSGKSLQGQRLAADRGYQWISVGALLRQANLAPELKAKMAAGELLDAETVQGVVGEALSLAPDPNKVILDGFPREDQQARWLLDHCQAKGYTINHVVHIVLGLEQAKQRLLLRGRGDDQEAAIERRFSEYRAETLPIIELFKQHGINVHEIDGSATVEVVYERIVQALDYVH